MLKREQGKLAFQGQDASKDPVRMLRMTGLGELDDATLLGALLDMKAHLSKDGVMEELHNKGREALRVLAERRAKAGG
ncbi:conjugal transfer protein TraD [Pseudomonadota bacterium]